MRRAKCSACGYSELDVFLNLGSTPIADAYVDDVAVECPTYSLELAVCTSCWLVQLLEVVDHKVLFGTGYSFYSSASPPLSAYHEEYAKQVLKTIQDDTKFVLEIGCNDGDFLRHINEAGHKALGVDPAHGPVGVARQRGLDVYERAFDRMVAQEILEDHGPADVIVVNHVLAHVEDVYELAAAIAMILKHDGTAWIEVQYLPDLLVNNAFDLVYHEHRNFFSLSSLISTFYRHNMTVVNAQQTERQGGSLRVQIQHGAEPDSLTNALVGPRDESWLRSIEAYRGFQGRVNRIRDRLLRLIDECDGHMIGYGAPAKATTLLNFCGIDSLKYVIDTTKAKQGRYIPGVYTPIVAPTADMFSNVDVTLLLAWNYAGDIRVKHPEFKGRWLLPIPGPMYI